MISDFFVRAARLQAERLWRFCQELVLVLGFEDGLFELPLRPRVPLSRCDPWGLRPRFAVSCRNGSPETGTDDPTVR
jgi:hypothetical protein